MSSRLRFAWYEATGRGSIVTSRPHSSRASRSAACSGCSPGRTLPERVSQAPAPASFRSERRMASTRPPRNTATATAATKRAESLILIAGRPRPSGRAGPPTGFWDNAGPGASRPGGGRSGRDRTILVEDLADFAGHDGQVERLLQEGDVATQDPVLAEGVVRVAGHEEDPHAGPQGGNARRQGAAAHLGQHDVRHQEIDRSLVLLADTQAFLGVAGVQHGVPIDPQAVAHDVADAQIVLHHQDGLGAPRGRRGVARLSRLGRLQGRWQIDSERGFAPWLAVAADVAVALLDDAIDRGPSAAGP